MFFLYSRSLYKRVLFFHGASLSAAFVSCFFKLPLALIILFLFYFFLGELTFFCTALSTFPFVKERMVEKYGDSLILKKGDTTHN